MGKVFSFDQVQQGSKVIPSSEDFEAAIENFETASHREISEGTLSGAVIYGSVAIRAYSLRSDFDCLLIPFNHSPESVAAINRVVSATNPTKKIDVSTIVHPKGRLESGMHEIDRYFGDHLTGSSRLVFGEDPADYIRYPEYGAYTHLISYIRHKKRSVAAGFTGEHDDYYKGLQRILELPLAVGRKTLRAVDDIDGTHFATADSANKARITPASIQLFDTLGLSETPNAILQLNARYNRALAEALDGELSEEEYDAVLDEIAGSGIDASNWLDELDDHLTRRYGVTSSLR